MSKDGRFLGILENGATLDTGRVADGRVSFTAISKLVARCATWAGALPALSQTVNAAQEASDHLKAKGFDPTVIDRVMWVVNERFPLSLAVFAERAIIPAPYGVGSVGGEVGRMVFPTRLGALKFGFQASFAEGRFARFTWEPKDHPGVTGLAGKARAGAVALRAGQGGAQKALARAGLSVGEAKRFVAGHELGHAIFEGAEHGLFCESLLRSSGLQFNSVKARAFGLLMVEELFADAMGSIAAKPNRPSSAMAAAGLMRNDSPFGSQPDPRYLRSLNLREPIGERLDGQMWSGSDGGRGLAAECLAMAVAHLSSLPAWRAKAKVAQGFEVLTGSPLNASLPKRSPSAPR